MECKKRATSCAEARKIDMVDYLASLGFQPAKIRNGDYWYCSPLRSEKTPSFKVDRKLNRWYDHGIGKGGNLIDFAILYNNCTVVEFLKTIDVGLSFHRPLLPVFEKREKESLITILAEKPLSSFLLHRYLHQRRIPLAVAALYCSEVTYQLNNKEYFGIGFKNNAGGWEIRNPYFKSSSAPKDFTTIEKCSCEVSVFEGFFDFLSYQTLIQKGDFPPSNFVVLNSVAFFEKARPYLEKHKVINLYLDRDSIGQNCTKQAVASSEKYKDQSCLYQHYKDLNDWVMHIGKLPK